MEDARRRPTLKVNGRKHTMNAEHFWRELELALGQIQRLDGSAALSKRRAAEIRYGNAYQGLVRLGVCRQLRPKYRRA